MDDIIQPKTKKFALRIVKLADYLVREKRENVMSS